MTNAHAPARLAFTCLLALLTSITALAAEPAKGRLKLMDVFELEYASDPQISPDGKRVVYVRNFMDVMKDRRRSNLWIINADGDEHRAMTTGSTNDASPRWSPDGKRLTYVAQEDKKAQIYCRWMDSGQTAKLTQLTSPPSDLTWSPDGKQIAFSMLVAEKVKPYVTLPEAPRGAEWANPPKVIRTIRYRQDGEGYLPDGFHHLFVIPSEGGTPRQITSGSFHHRGPFSWSPDGKAIVFAANRTKDWETERRESEIYEVSLKDKSITQRTKRRGPDASPTLSPDGKRIAYVGFDDRLQGYQVTQLYVMNRDGSEARAVTKELDRDVQSPVWSADGTRVYFQYDDHGVTRIGSSDLNGNVKRIAENVGGTTIGRPYASGSFSVANNNRIAFTMTTALHPGDVAVADGKTQRLTRLNDDLFADKELGSLETIQFESSHDARMIEGWILKPPGFDAKKKYPLILEIHGGPFANYGPRFSMEMQLFAAAGYVVLFVNPRGSTSYGEKFGNLIHHNYPSQDYDDLMSGVDAVLERRYVAKDQLYVTGGSGGGVLSSWIIGKTDRFRAAVVCKPVINWLSFSLTADIYPFFVKYWFPDPPWKNPEHYWKRSSLSLVGNVKTPTMVLTGEVDHRTPMSESEQYYQALKLCKVDAMLVRIPGASHFIAKRPSQMMTKVAYVLKWFKEHK